MRIFKPKRKESDGSHVAYERFYVEFWDHQRIQRRAAGGMRLAPLVRFTNSPTQGLPQGWVTCKY